MQTKFRKLELLRKWPESNASGDPHHSFLRSQIDWYWWWCCWVSDFSRCGWWCDYFKSCSDALSKGVLEIKRKRRMSQVVTETQMSFEMNTNQIFLKFDYIQISVELYWLSYQSLMSAFITSKGSLEEPCCRRNMQAASLCLGPAGFEVSTLSLQTLVRCMS